MNFSPLRSNTFAPPDNVILIVPKRFKCYETPKQQQWTNLNNETYIQEPEELSSKDIWRYTQTPLRLPNIRIPKKKPAEESPKDEPAETEQISTISPTISPSISGQKRRITTPKRRNFPQNALPISSKFFRPNGDQFNRKEAEEWRAREFLLHEFLSEIFNWNPNWLHEQKTLKKSDPPVVNNEKLWPLLEIYNNYDDYYKILKPLLLLEIWHSTYSDFESEGFIKKISRTGTMKSFKIIETQNKSMSKIFYSSFHFEVAIDRESYEKQVHPSQGDLVILQYYTETTECVVFGYVVKLQKVAISSSEDYNQNLYSNVQHPHTLLVYTVNSRPLVEHPDQTKPINLQTICYLRSELKEVRALLYLPSSPLLELILKPTMETWDLNRLETGQCSLLDPDTLNAKQMSAVLRTKSAACQENASISLIQGPPGTGKSKVIVNIVREIFSEGLAKRNVPKILLCAPSNTAVDELVLRLIKVQKQMRTENQFRLVRMGRLEVMHPDAKEVALTTIAERRVVERLYSEDEEDNIEYPGENKIKRRRKNKKYQSFVMEAEKDTLRRADIIACTLNSCYSNQMESVFKYDKIPICIVDEATQCCEITTLIPLMFGVKTLVLVGDSKQLPAIVISQRAKALGWDISLFSRIQKAFGKAAVNPVITLTTQYRMVEPILQWPNAYFYNNILQGSVREHPHLLMQPYLILEWQSKQDTNRYTNSSEADFILNLIRAITTLIKTETTLTLGIITPYNDQKSLIQQRLRSFTSNFVIDVNTVDGFQGQERDIILMSCVRSNQIGFLSDEQRLCVALTRAKSCLYICGNFTTFRNNLMWNDLLTNAESRGLFRSLSSYSVKSIKKVIKK